MAEIGPGKKRTSELSENIVKDKRMSGADGGALSYETGRKLALNTKEQARLDVERIIERY